MAEKKVKDKEEKELSKEDIEEENKKLKAELKKKEEKEAKEERKERFNKIMNVILWIILIVWMCICLTDFFLVQKQKDPIFCIKRGTTKYDDGNVKWCLGPGYKTYDYNRSSFNGVQYGPFWIKDASNKTEEN